MIIKQTHIWIQIAKSAYWPCPPNIWKGGTTKSWSPNKRSSFSCHWCVLTLRIVTWAAIRLKRATSDTVNHSVIAVCHCLKVALQVRANFAAPWQSGRWSGRTDPDTVPSIARTQCNWASCHKTKRILKRCSHCRRKVRLSHFSATVWTGPNRYRTS